MSSPAFYAFILLPAGLLLALASFLAYVWRKYAPIIGRIFEDAPVFQPLRTDPPPGGEDVTFPTPDGLELHGTYYPGRNGRGRLGVVVFCHEFLGDRWSARHYADHLRDLGFDVFTFDFRNHGTSETDPRYRELQWVSDLEVLDLRAALDYLRTRPDRDPAGVALYGVSRGGGAALCVTAEDPGVWAVATDGAFPTRGTVLAYILRWAEIYVGNPYMWKYMPRFVFAFAGWAGRISTQRRLGRRYPDVEQAVSRVAPRPWLMVHGEKDAYIGPEIARALFAAAREPKELRIVAGAKHNRCREVAPAAYDALIADFLLRHAPRVAPAPAPSPRPSTNGDGDGGAPPVAAVAPRPAVAAKVPG